MISENFERIISKIPTQINQSQLLQLEAYCSAKSFNLQKWIDISITLFKSNPEHCYQFLSYLDKQELSRSSYNDYIYQGSKITIYSHLTGLVLSKATRQSSRQQSQKLINEAKKFLNSSEKVRMTVDKSIILNRAFMHYYAGQVTKALNFVSRTHEQIIKTGQGKHLLVTTTLMLAQINFIKKNYQKSLELYKKCLEINKNLPTKARLGMAYSFYYLGKYQMARACFQRILKLDATCVQAYLGLAVIEDKCENQSLYFKNLYEAYNLNKQHPLTLMHIAEHYLIRNDLQKAYKFCQNGLIAVQRYPKFCRIEEAGRNDYQELKNRFNNIIGQIHHINYNYSQAIKYYTFAGKDLVHNQISLAQTYLNPTTQNYPEAIRILDEVYKQYEGKDSRIVSDTYRLMGYLKSKIPPKNKQDKGAEYYYGQALKFNRKQFESKIEYASILCENQKNKALTLLQQAQKIQIANKNYIKPQFQNNIAVLELQNGEPQLCEQRLKKCLKNIDGMQIESEEDEIRQKSLKIIVNFNYAICLQKQSRWQSAKKIYQQILKSNKYHIDSYIKLAETEFQLGNLQKARQIFDQAERHCSQNRLKLLRPQKIITARAYIEYLSGNTLGAKQILKQLGKAKDLYVHIFQLCINYENIMRKGVQMSTLKQFLRPNREFLYKYCSQDPNAAFGYMLLAIILLSDKKMKSKQGHEFFFLLKQFASPQLPIILYNLAVFLTSQEQYQESNYVLNLYKNRIKTSIKADELISLNDLLMDKYQECQSNIKRNILRDPTNLKFRMQLAYVLEKKALKYYQKSDFDKAGVNRHLKNLQVCNNMQSYFSKMNIAQYIRGIQIPQVKQKTRNCYTKIKSIGQQRKFYIKSYIDTFEKIAKQMEFKQRQRLEDQKRDQQKRLNEQKQRQLQQLLELGQESEDEEEKQRKEKQRKRQKALQLAKKRQAEMQVTWNQLKQKQKQVMQIKQSRKRNTSSKPSGAKARKQKPKQQSQSPLQELQQQDQSQPQVQYSQSQSQQQVKKKHKKQKKQKKRKRQKDRERKKLSQSEDDGDEERQKPEKKQKEDENDDDDENILKYLV